MNSRLIDGDKDEVLLEEVDVASPGLHPVVLSLLDPGRDPSTDKGRTPAQRDTSGQACGTGGREGGAGGSRTGGQLTGDWPCPSRSSSRAGSAACRRRS